MGLSLALGGALAIAAYLLGSISTGLVYARVRGIDLRAAGSGNVGATNASRVLGRRAGLIVFAGDFIKGLLPAVATRLVMGTRPQAPVADAVVALSAVLGHLWPIWHGFRGGKGVATAGGAFLALAPSATAIAAATWLVLFLPLRIASIASLAAALALPIALLLMGANTPLAIAALFTAFLIFLRHRDNLARLARREEKPMPPPG